MTEEIPVCPECGHSGIHANRVSGYRDYGDVKKYGCHGCYAKFDEPDHRERERECPLSGLARKLADADPDDVGGHP